MSLKFPSRNLLGKDETSTDDAKYASAGEVFPNEIDDHTNTTEDRSKVKEHYTENFTSQTEDVPNTSDDSAAKNVEILKDTEHNPAMDENQLNDGIRNSTSGEAHPDEIVAADQVNLVIDDSIDDTIDDISEATDSEHSKSEELNGAIEIPGGSVDSADHTNYLSSSDVCSLSSWRETKGLPSLTTVSNFLEENESFSENTKDSSLDNSAQIGADSGSSNDSHALHDGHDLRVSSRARSAGDRDSQQQTVDGEMDPRNSISQTGSTTSSIRSGEPTDTEDGEAFSESMSSISTTNSCERPKVFENRPNGNQLSQLNSKSSTNDTVAAPSKDGGFHDNKTCTDETDALNSTENNLGLNGTEDDPDKININGNIDNGTADVFAVEDTHAQANSREVKDSVNSTCGDVTDAGQKFQPTEAVGGQSGSVGEQSGSVGAQSDGVDAHSENVDANSESGGDKSGNSGALSEGFVSQSGNDVTESGNIDEQSGNVGEQSDTVGEEPGGADTETGATKSETAETGTCTLCKESVPVDQLRAFALDVAELIEQKYLHCWRSGVCFSHPEVFLVVVYRPLSDSVVVEIAVSPNALGRRLLTFVVDHLDTLIKEWYPGLLMTYGAEPIVQKRIPCRSCEKDGKPKPHMFSFDSCVTQYSMGNFVKCPEHEVGIQDIAPDVVLQDIDADLLLQEDELEYDRSDANMIGKGKGTMYS